MSQHQKVSRRSPHESHRSDPTSCFVVALGSSAGGLMALSSILGDLPPDFPAPIVLVQHLDPRYRSLMPEILAQRTGLVVRESRDGDFLVPGNVLTAPPDRHLLVNADRSISLTQTELVHFVRPSADLLFESVAASFGRRSIAVVLTGTGSDGSMGVQAIRKKGGTAIAQDPMTAQFNGMPSAAIQTGAIDMILPLDQIARMLINLVTRCGT